MAPVLEFYSTQESVISPTDAKERLIVALDLQNVEEARQIVRDTHGIVSFFKVGLVLQLAEGVGDFIKELISEGNRVFLDYKYYDISETIRSAVDRAAKLGVTFLTVHGSSNLIRAAVEGKGNSDLKLFTVTVLTSMDKSDIAELGYSNQTVEELVLYRAKKALEAGCDGVIASAEEAAQIKAMSQGKLLIAAPGIRPNGSPADDQKRKATAREALIAGADYLVVGRPIVKAPSPKEAAIQMLSEMQDALDHLASRPSGI